MVKNRLQSQDGMVLILVLMLMVVIAIMGTMAVNMSSIDLQIFGNQKRGTEAFEMAESGIDLSIPVIEQTLIDGVNPDIPDPPELPWQSIALNPDLGGEILGETVEGDGVNDQPDIVATATEGRAQVDIDRLYSYALAGGAMEFAGGYEGVGASAAGGGTAILYRVRSEGFR